MSVGKTDQATTRRTFLKVTLAAGVGLNLSWTPAISAQTAAASLGPWISIHPDNTITVMIARSEMGQGIETGLAMLVAEELEADWSLIGTQWAPSDPIYGSQLTAASNSIRSMWEPMRIVGASAREMLRQAAASQWKVSASDCRCSHSTVTHPDGRQQFKYGELVEAASRQSIPESVTLKDPSQFQIIGQRLPRLDATAKVTGEAVYGPDINLPGMLIACVARCPFSGGQVASFDSSKAAAMPGIEAVFPMDDQKSLRYGIAVVGSGFWPVQEALKVLKVEWDNRANEGLSTPQMIRRLARAADRDPAQDIVDRGDLAAAQTASSQHVTSSYYVPFLAHVPMSPMCCTADIREDRGEVWAPTQGIGRAAAVLESVTGLPRDALTIHKTYLGGAFGRRQHQDYVAKAAIISQRMGRAIKVLWSREDDIRHDFFRPMSYDRLSAWLSDDGMPLGWRHRIASTGSTVLSSVGADATPYAIANKHVGLAEVLEPIRTGPWRAVANSQTAFVVECFIDELAAAIKQDPYNYRRTLLADAPRFLEVLNTVARVAGWETPLPPDRFRGIAIHETEGSIVASVALVSVAGHEIKVHHLTSVIDCSIVINPSLVEAQVEGAAIDGLTTALKSEITIKDGVVEQSNFHDYPMLRMHEAPPVDVHIVASRKAPTGAGEAGLPPIAPAIANAVSLAVGRRIRTLPIHLERLAATDV